MIENLDYLKKRKHNSPMEGTFKSKTFKNDKDDTLSVYLENDTIVGYVVKCIEHFNSMSDNMIDILCKNIIICYKNFGGTDKNYTLPELENFRDILKYCWFSSITIDAPETDEIAYLVEGEGEWGECIVFIVKDNKVLYVGCDSSHSPWEDDEYYKSLEDNCIYL